MKTQKRESPTSDADLNRLRQLSGQISDTMAQIVRTPQDVERYHALSHRYHELNSEANDIEARYQALLHGEQASPRPAARPVPHLNLTKPTQQGRQRQRLEGREAREYGNLGSHARQATLRAKTASYVPGL